MGWRDRLFGRRSVIGGGPEDIEDVQEGLPVELNIVGESNYQNALAAVAGKKDHDGKQLAVGVALRCEPSNAYDANAVRVEVMGQLVAYVARAQAAVVSPAVRERAGGAIKASGCIVGGWKRPGDEGSYGIRVSINGRTAARLGINDESLRGPQPLRRLELPAPTIGERRMGPTKADIEAGLYGSQVTVTCEEHYQDVITATMPTGWNPQRSWPLLIELATVESNPHASSASPCIEVRCHTSGRTLGYLTPKMSERHFATVRSATDAGLCATAAAEVSRGAKGGQTILRVKATMPA